MPPSHSATADDAPPARTGHPPGLWVLFITEMWERFSYYGMRALLVLYLIASTSETLKDGKPNTNPGFGWSEEHAYILYGVYTWAVYLTPIFGGWLADRFLGTHRSMLVGGWIIAAGHVTLALTELFGITAGEVVTLQTAPGALICFVCGLVLIVIGTGFFKPCVSVMVGQLYQQGDPRRDSGFTYFYMGINLGAFFSPLVAGTLGETIGWHWGFGSAAVGMLAGLFFYQMYRPRYLAGIGEPPATKGNVRIVVLAVAALALMAMILRRFHAVLLPWLQDLVQHPAFWTIIVAAGVVTIIAFVLRQQPYERGPLGVIFVLSFVGNLVFWAAFEQAGSSLNVFAKEKTDRTLWGLLGHEDADDKVRPDADPAANPDGANFAAGSLRTFPASWYQSVNPLAILVFAPVFSWLWVRLTRLGANPSTPMKFAWALYLLGLAFIAMVLGAFETEGGRLAGPHWLLITYIVSTWGELCLSPVGLSMVTKLAPERLQSQMMGVWFFSSSLSNLLAGLMAAFSKRLESGDATFVFPGLPGFYLLMVVLPIAAGLLMTVLAPLLKRMAHGVE
jgi:POT family proton-dependent oligopeptide transporter